MNHSTPGLALARVEARCASVMEDSLIASALHPLALRGQRYRNHATPMPSRKRSRRLCGEICCSESCDESLAILRQHVLLLR